MKRLIVRCAIAFVCMTVLVLPALAAKPGGTTDPPAETTSCEAGTPISALPFTISESGYYFVTGDLTATASGIIVAADHVTIDLKGHSIASSGNTRSRGIHMVGRSNVEILNGTIRNFGDGIWDDQTTGGPHKIENVRLLDNGYYGIYLKSRNNAVKCCVASGNGIDGINVANDSIVMGNRSLQNGQDGIRAGAGSLVKENVANKNGNDGIRAEIYVAVIENTTGENMGSGISASTGAPVKGNTASYNSLYGINLTGGDSNGNNLVDGNAALGNGTENIRPCSSCTFGTNHAP